MAQAEMVTVRMSRGQMDTPWGFDIGPELAIVNVIGGSLADRAGLLNGDVLVELEGHQNLNVELAKQLLSKTEHRVELIVHRTGDNIIHRIWRPSVTGNTEYNKFQHSVFNVPSTDGQKMEPPIVPLKVSLEHQNPEPIPIPGFNVAAQPFGDHQEVKHLQYNSPMSLYSPQTAAEQYLQQTGGLFGTDPNLAKQKEVPLYLRSETLRLIQESERSKENGEHAISVRSTKINQEQTRPNVENIPEAPMCFICGRNIKGVMCRAYDRTMHSDCFQCSTCGSFLKNQGHHFINDKFYCDIHGRQLRGGSSVAKRDQIHWSVARKPKIVPTSDKNTLLTPYQPEVMTRQSISIIPTPWKTQSPISPSNRGVPPAATLYGQELNELKKEIYNSSMSSGNMSDQQSHQPSQKLLSRVRSLPLEIQKVTSPRRLPCKHHWPPESHKIKRYWQCSYLIADVSKDSISSKPGQDELLLPLSKYIKENEDKLRKPPNPKQYLLRGEEKSYHWKPTNHLEKPIDHLEKNRTIEGNFSMACRCHLMPCDMLFRNSNYSEHTEQRKKFLDEYNCDVEEMHKIDIENLIDNVNSCECDNWRAVSPNDIDKYQEMKEYIQNKPDLVTICQNINHEIANSEIRENQRKGYEREGQNFDEGDVVDVDTHNSMEVKNPPIKERRDVQELCGKTEPQDVKNHCDEIGNIGLDTIEKEESIVEMEKKFITNVSQDITVKDLSHSEKNRKSKGNRWTTCEEWNVLDINNENQKVMKRIGGEIEKGQKEYTGLDLIEERDKQIAIESITRYQLQLHDPAKELSYMLENTIDFLKNLNNMEDRLVDGNGFCHQQQESTKYPGPNKVIKVVENRSNNCRNLAVNRDSYIKPSNVHESQNDELPKGRGILHTQSNRAPCCKDCRQEIRGAYVLANGLAYCPNHFICSNKSCGRKLLDIGFVEEKGHKYCERCFETEIAPRCAKCNQPITADCLNALQKQWHPHCFVCAHCHNPFGNSAFFLEQGQPYCETDWNRLFTTKCVSCHYPIEAGDRWVEALGAAFHSNCFNCTSCNVNLEGENFYAKNGAPYCKLHA
ncbi:unnamed protein product [Cercopithifilaria johnstoni]|uniref:PDZ and LIM domain protein Zasp n=1 Tax=Cercopithifilaria johnstoni TaxID=2874296 RepID=A0A8J2M1A1_9BILA|nr:unnamed protein product [Cercopithifilaria johnstoni]